MRSVEDVNYATIMKLVKNLVSSLSSIKKGEKKHNLYTLINHVIFISLGIKSI